jgi:methylmalonyl-CoA/ethylmalonyl-CoA epimerase
MRIGLRPLRMLNRSADRFSSEAVVATKGRKPMILNIDHVGVVARSLDDARRVLIDTLGFHFDEYRSPNPNGFYMRQENADIFFIEVGHGETRIELLLPRDDSTGMGRWLRKRGPSVHHLAYMVDDLELHARELVGKGLSRIDLGESGKGSAAFFYPNDTMGILTELVDVNTMERMHSS